MKINRKGKPKQHRGWDRGWGGRCADAQEWDPSPNPTPTVPANPGYSTLRPSQPLGSRGTTETPRDSAPHPATAACLLPSSSRAKIRRCFEKGARNNGLVVLHSSLKSRSNQPQAESFPFLAIRVVTAPSGNRWLLNAD